MSFPDTWIKCKQCSKKFSADVLAGRYVYELSDGSHLPIERKFGWCHSCNTLVPVEDLNPANLAREIAESTDELKQHTGVLAGFSAHHKGHAERLKKILTRLHQQKSFIDQRESPEHCLACG